MVKNVEVESEILREQLGPLNFNPPTHEDTIYLEVYCWKGHTIIYEGNTNRATWLWAGEMLSEALWDLKDKECPCENGRMSLVQGMARAKVGWVTETEGPTGIEVTFLDSWSSPKLWDQVTIWPDLSWLPQALCMAQLVNLISNMCVLGKWEFSATGLNYLEPSPVLGSKKVFCL